MDWKGFWQDTALLVWVVFVVLVVFGLVVQLGQLLQGIQGP